jgi:hypothetical protein
VANEDEALAVDGPHGAAKLLVRSDPEWVDGDPEASARPRYRGQPIAQLAVV